MIKIKNKILTRKFCILHDTNIILYNMNINYWRKLSDLHVTEDLCSFTIHSCNNLVGKSTGYFPLCIYIYLMLRSFFCLGRNYEAILNSLESLTSQFAEIAYGWTRNFKILKNFIIRVFLKFIYFKYYYL